MNIQFSFNYSKLNNDQFFYATEKLLEKSEDVATEIRDCLNTAMHNEVLDLQEHSEEFRNYSKMASVLIESAIEQVQGGQT